VRLLLPLAALAIAWPAAALAQASQPATTQPAGSGVAAPLDQQSVPLGQQIYDVMFPPEVRDAKMRQLMVTMLEQAKGTISLPKIFEEPGLKHLMDDAFNSIPDRMGELMHEYQPRLREAMARAYAREFAASELESVLTFARTPAGKHYLERSTAIMGDSDVAAVNHEYFMAMQKVMEGLKSDLQARLFKYFEAHPELVKRIEAEARKGK
jgi:hypothetical protein